MNDFNGTQNLTIAKNRKKSRNRWKFRNSTYLWVNYPWI